MDTWQQNQNIVRNKQREAMDVAVIKQMMLDVVMYVCNVYIKYKWFNTRMQCRCKSDVNVYVHKTSERCGV